MRILWCKLPNFVYTAKVALFSKLESLVELYAAVREWRKAEPRGPCSTSWISCSQRAKRLYSVA